MSTFEEALCFHLRELQRALVEVAAVMDAGRTSHPTGDGFRQSSRFHIDRAAKHLAMMREGDTAADHLAQAAARLRPLRGSMVPVVCAGAPAAVARSARAASLRRRPEKPKR